MPYWDCPRCSTENSLNATACWRCGYQYFPGYQGAAAPHETPRPGSLEMQRKDLSDRIRRGLEEELKSTHESLERIATAGSTPLPDATPKDKPRDR